MTVTDKEAPLEELKSMTVRDEFGRNGMALDWEGEGQGDFLAYITPA